jgi:integrase/recombinase XerD
MEFRIADTFTATKKGRKQHEMPVHHKLELYLDEYLKAAGIADDERGPLFRTAMSKTGVLTENAIHRIDAYRRTGGSRL